MTFRGDNKIVIDPLNPCDFLCPTCLQPRWLDIITEEKRLEEEAIRLDCERLRLLEARMVTQSAITNWVKGVPRR